MTNGSCSRRLYELPLGRTHFQQVWDFQKELVSRRAAGQIPDCLITTEHEPVITMGRGTNESNLLVSSEELNQRGVTLFEIERGGDITFHGPGQLVLYPIIDLKQRGRDTHQYLRDLEQVAIRTLADFGLTAGIKEGLTGVWVDDHKVGAIGVAVSKWITYHGIAINVTTDLSYFDLIKPCGITEHPVGSVAALLGHDPGPDQFRSVMVKHFAEYFGYTIETVGDPDSLITDR
jgi:lipoate-protein ligase B